MNDAARWLTEGAGVREGLRLLAKYEPNPYLARMVEARPGLYGHLLHRILERYAEGLPEQRPVPEQRGPSFRERWPFLSRADCPMELKALAADKITAYHNTLELHEKLYSCETPEECFETAKKLLKNFTQNRQISSEFAYYKEHGAVLGKHPIFQESRKTAELRQMSILGLVAEERRLEGAVWRIRSEMAKGDRPYLQEARQMRLQQKQARLDLVRTMISDYEKNTKKR